MGNDTTAYDVQLRYVYKEAGARSGVRSLTRDLDAAAIKSSSLKTGLLAVGAAVTTGFLGMAGKKAFVDFNDQLEQARIQMSGMLMQAGDGTWEESLIKSNQLISDFQILAKQSIGTTKDFVDMASMIVRPITAAGLGMKDIEEFTRGAVVASRAFGIASDVAARDIESALMGQLRSVDRFARALLEPMGYVGEEGRSRFNQLSGSERAAKLKAGLTSDAIKSMAKSQEFSFSGVTSTLKDNLEMTLGKIGLPLFKEITNEVKKWNEWIDKNPEKIKQFAADFTNALAEGFKIFKEIASFIVQNKDLLIMLAKAYMASKAVGFVAGGVAGLAKSLASLAATGPGSFGALGLSLAGVTAALGAFAAATVIVADEVDQKQTREINAKGDFGVLDRGMREFLRGKGGTYADGSRESRVAGRDGEASANLMLANRMLDQAREQGMLIKTKGGGSYINAAEIAQRGSDAGRSTTEIQTYIAALQMALAEESKFYKGLTFESADKLFGTKYQGIKDAFAEGATLWSKMTIHAWGQQFDAGFSNKMGLILMNALSLVPTIGSGNLMESLKGKTKDKQEKTKVNVTIQRIEVQSNDPDRFVFMLGEIGRRARKNPSQAHGVLREG